MIMARTVAARAKAAMRRAQIASFEVGSVLTKRRATIGVRGRLTLRQAIEDRGGSAQPQPVERCGWRASASAEGGRAESLKRARHSLFCIFPVAVCGISATNTTSSGIHQLAILPRMKPRISSRVAD